MPSYKQRAGQRTWTVTWDEPPDPETGKRKQRSKGGFPTKRAASTWLKRYEIQQLESRSPIAAEMTVGDYVLRWLAGHQVGDGSINTYTTYLRRYIVPYIGTVKFGELQTHHVETWHRALIDSGLSPQTIQHAHTLLSTALNAGVARGELLRNVARGARTLPRIERRHLTVWDEDDIRRFFAVADSDRLGLLFRLMVFSQIRPGEALALRWEDVNWRRGTIHIQRTIGVDREGRYTIREQPKTPSSRRTIPLSPDLMERLRLRQETQQQECDLASDLWQEHGLVFCRQDGAMLHPSTVRSRLQVLVNRAGVPRITPHGLRHTGATLLMAMNEHPRIVSERLGHKSVGVTLDTYSHVSSGMQRAVSERLSTLLESAHESHDDRVIDDAWKPVPDGS